MREKLDSFSTFATTSLPFLLLLSCSDANLEPVQDEPPPAFDDKLEVRGSICTTPPGDEFFPVKIMLIIDTSDSMRETDPTQQRLRAVIELLDRFRGNPSVKFSIIAFDAVTSDVTNGFTSNPDLTTITNRLDDADRLTDYQGALGRAYAILTRDMIDSSPAERARSKYVIVFFSDGVPDPQCIAGAAVQPRQVCAVPRDDWPDTFQLPAGINPNTGAAWTWEDFQGLFPDMLDGRDYNTKDQLVEKVREILELQEIYNVNEIRFHTGFLWDPNLNPAFIPAFGLDRPKAIDLLTAMATAGNGTFTEFTFGASISFLNINYTATKSVYEMTNFFAINGSSMPGPSAAKPDSDGDGLPDELEDELRTCSYIKGGVNCNLGNGNFADPLDTDGDGYGDFFEYRFRSSGFDPKVGATLTAPCRQTDDSDGDGLKDCEEVFIGTDERLYDSDADRIPDGIEVRFGLDPANRADPLFDTDSDGTRNVEEVQRHWDPLAREPATALPPQVKYDIVYGGETQDGRNCYTFDSANLKLHTTRAVTAVDRGVNTIWLTFMEGPRNDPRDYGSARVACVRARYVEPDLKQPATGVLDMTSEAECLEWEQQGLPRPGCFFEPTDPALECLRPCGADGDCAGPGQGEVCEGRGGAPVCLPRCDLGRTCLEGKTCDEASGRCIEGAPAP